MTGTQSRAMTLAILAITHADPEKRLSPPEAAKKYDIKVNSIYRRPMYKEWIKAQKEQSNAQT